ncbi:MAG: hypothetical protein ACD_76C00130G0009 [uncultured bacterium]|nr:MAG: hypothetical protein ACD_76C00130G0009 [uncultured bacterium]
MPILQNAKKELRKSKKRFSENQILRSEVEALRRKFKIHASKNSLKEAKEIAQSIQQKIDKAVKKNILKQNNGNRIKSRIADKIKAMQK